VQLTACLMPSDQHNSRLHAGLIFSLFNIAFGIPQYTKGILHGLTRVFFVCHSSLLTAISVDLVVTHDRFLSQRKFSVFFIVVTLITGELF